MDCITKNDSAKSTIFSYYKNHFSTANVKRPIYIGFVLTLFFFTSVFAFARPAPQAIHDPTPLQLVGKGTMTWWGFALYDASLWSATGQYIKFDDALPIALHITYKKNIPSEKLVETTVDEWKRLEFFDEPTRQHWGQQLFTLWPDVKPDDSITTLVTLEKQTRFYVNGKLAGQIDNPELSYALLSIWLHPDTIAPKLRAKLIGKLTRIFHKLSTAAA